MALTSSVLIESTVCNEGNHEFSEEAFGAAQLDGAKLAISQDKADYAHKSRC
jgi:hypothetical protein